MIKGCNDFDLNKKEVDKKYILFYQVWKELTEKKTVDTYQFRIMNTLASLREISNVIELRLKQQHKTNHNIEECKKETSSIVSQDKVLKNHYPAIYRRLLTHLHEKTDTPFQQRALRYQITYCHDLIVDTYIEYLFADLEHSIEIANAKEILTLANQLISNCSTMGWSMRALNDIIHIFHCSISTDNKWRDFKQLLIHTKTLYIVLIPLRVRIYTTPYQNKSLLKENLITEIKKLGIDVCDSRELQNHFPYISTIEKNNQYLVVEVQAHDFYAASHVAICKCSEVFNLFSFYGLIEPWNISNLSWLTINPDEQSFKVLKIRGLYGVYDYMDGAYKIYCSSKEIYAGVSNSIQSKLNAVYSYASMGKAAYSPTEKFINAWIALESLCRTDIYDNIITNILETVPAALCLRYIYKCYC